MGGTIYEKGKSVSVYDKIINLSYETLDKAIRVNEYFTDEEKASMIQAFENKFNVSVTGVTDWSFNTLADFIDFAVYSGLS